MMLEASHGLTDSDASYEGVTSPKGVMYGAHVERILKALRYRTYLGCEM